MFFLSFFVVCLLRSTFAVTENEFLFLQDLYYSTNGDNWYNNANWQFDLYNITADQICVNRSLRPYGIYCKSGHIRMVALINNNLNGTLPDTTLIQNITKQKCFHRRIYTIYALSMLRYEFFDEKVYLIF